MNSYLRANIVKKKKKSIGEEGKIDQEWVASGVLLFSRWYLPLQSTTFLNIYHLHLSCSYTTSDRLSYECLKLISFYFSQHKIHVKITKFYYIFTLN